MPAYTLPLAAEAAVLSGQVRGLLSAPRNAPTTAPHADVGEAVFVRAPHTKATPARRLAERSCVLRARLVMTADALVRALDVARFLHGPYAQEAEPIARLIAAAEQGAAGDTAQARDRLARFLGFTDWTAAYRHHSDQGRRGRPDKHGRIERELIVWSAT